MKHILLLLVLFSCASATDAQQKPTLDYINKVPVAFKNCGTLYTYDSVALQKKKYILLTDFQNQGLISINGHLIKLQLTGSNTSGKINTSTYNGNGYTITVNYHTVSPSKKYDLEVGVLTVSRGNRTINFKIHGRSACDESRQESNSK